MLKTTKIDGRVFWEWYSGADHDDGKPYKRIT